jgi:hypothetical protein
MVATCLLAIIISPLMLRSILLKITLIFRKYKDTLNYRVLLLGDFNVPGFDWNSGLPSPNCHFYTKLKGDVIHSATCFLGLSQLNYSDSGSNLLDLVFSYFADLTVAHPVNGLVQPDNFHPPFIIDCSMPVRLTKQNCNILYKRFSSGN